MEKTYEEMKVDCGLPPTSLATANATGAYYSLAEFRKAIAILNVADMAKTKTCKIEVFQGKNSAGGSGALLAGATATITANVNVAALTLALSTVLATHTIIINGLSFLADAATTTVADREFSIAGGTDTLDGDELCTCINDPTYGVPGVTAVNDAGTITLTATDPGAVAITAAQGVGATITVATLRAVAYVEVDALTLSDDFTHVACKITTSDTIIAGAVLLRGGKRQAITQAVGASASV
jgi:hypothetical protein